MSTLIWKQELKMCLAMQKAKENYLRKTKLNRTQNNTDSLNMEYPITSKVTCLLIQIITQNENMSPTGNGWVVKLYNYNKEFW